MKYQDVINLVEEKKETTRVQKLKQTLTSHLHRLDDNDYANRALTYYYLVHVILSSHTLYETKSGRIYYEQMKLYFERAEKKLLNKWQKNGRISIHLKEELDTFYRLMERCYASLEVLYHKKTFVESVAKAYETKMNYRKKYFWWQKKYWRWFEYVFLDVTSKYGDSFFRWGLTSLVFGLLMSIIFAGLDYFSLPAERMVAINSHWYDYVYFSITTLTTLGYGDVVPITIIAKLIATLEVFFGYIMLGIFITLIQKKL